MIHSLIRIVFIFKLIFVPSMVKLAMPTEDAHKDPCEQNLRLLQNMIAAEYTVLLEARSERGELDRVKWEEINLLTVSCCASI